MPGKKKSVAQQRIIFIAISLALAGAVLLGIYLYPRLFLSNRPKALTQAKEMYAQHRAQLHGLLADFQTIRQAFPNKAISISAMPNRETVVLRIDSVTSQGEEVFQVMYYDNWPIPKTDDLRYKLSLAHVGVMHNEGEIVYFNLAKELLHRHHTFAVYTPHNRVGETVDTNWAVLLREMPD